MHSLVLLPPVISRGERFRSQLINHRTTGVPSRVSLAGRQIEFNIDFL